ncbi:MAG: GNAT family N-acetyltransferase, partial [Cyanobacteria bacterium P01_H01_bin.153]
VESYWQSQGAMGGVFWWPTAASWIEPTLHQRDFLTYTAMAVRPGDDLAALSRAPSDGLTIRRAQPGEEETLLQFMVEEMIFHEDITPFARVVPGIELDGRQRLADAWSGNSPEAGASLFFVAEQQGQIVGMLECALSDLRDRWHNLAPELYGDINTAIVAETYRGQGIGHSLLATAVHELKRYGARRFSLYYVQANPLSSRFWQSKGFRPVLSSYHKRYDDEAKS